jgi:hypothetical protein
MTTQIKEKEDVHKKYSLHECFIHCPIKHTYGVVFVCCCYCFFFNVNYYSFFSCALLQICDNRSKKTIKTIKIQKRSTCTVRSVRKTRLEKVFLKKKLKIQIAFFIFLEDFSKNTFFVYLCFVM